MLHKLQATIYGRISLFFVLLYIYLSHCDWPEMVLFLKHSFRPSYIATMNGGHGAILYLVPHVINHFQH